jgi:hypothetical protein
LHYVQQRNVSALLVATAVPSAIVGFQPITGPEADACRARSTNKGEVDDPAGLVFEIRTRADLSSAIPCLFLDTLLMNYIPDRSPQYNNGWPPDRGKTADGTVGLVSTVTPETLAPALRKYRDALLPRRQTHHFVQTRMADNNGVTNHALFVIPLEGPAIVDAVYIHVLFEE